jgi:predicted HicB family RNase H-like nuclease
MITNRPAEPWNTYSGKAIVPVNPNVQRKAALTAELAGKSLKQSGKGLLNRAAG